MAAPNVSRYVDGERLWHRHEALAAFGALPGGGVNRQALSQEEIAARAKLIAWSRAIGLVPYTDCVANLFLRLPGLNEQLPPLLMGSHIDTQPTGGRFDGTFGVLAALEVMEAFVAAGHRPPRSIEVVAWMNEEGSRFAPGMMGSAAYTGARNVEDILAVSDSAGVNVATSVEQVLAADIDVPCRPLRRPLAGYLEAHIEQGPILEARGCQIGIVTSIQGKRTFRVIVAGEESHAGTSPRSTRRDALASAVRIISALQNAMHDADDITRFTVGMLRISPNAPSVVPASAVMSIDLRHPDAATLQRLGDLVSPLCGANCSPCSVLVEELLYDPPLTFPFQMRKLLAEAAIDQRVRFMDIASGAGHDARYLHYFCPSGMVFIPCKKGISHSEAESAKKEDIVAATKILAAAAEVLSDRESDALLARF